MSNKTTVVSAHLAPLAAIASIAGINFGTFMQEKDIGLKTNDQLQQAIGAAKTIPFMAVKDNEQLVGVTSTIGRLTGAMANSKAHDQKLVELLTKELADAGNAVVHNFHSKQNGAGKEPHVDRSAIGAGKMAEHATQ